MASREAISPQIARELEQISEFWPHIAFDAGNGGAPGEIFIGEIVDHRLAKAALVIEHIMRDAQPIAHGARIANVAPGAAAAGAANRLAMIIKLQRDADHFSPGAHRERRHDRAVDPARHGDDDALAARRAVQLKISGHHCRADTRIARVMQKIQRPFGKLATGFTGPSEPRGYTLKIG